MVVESALVKLLRYKIATLIRVKLRSTATGGRGLPSPLVQLHVGEECNKEVELVTIPLLHVVGDSVPVMISVEGSVEQHPVLYLSTEVGGDGKQWNVVAVAAMVVFKHS